MKQTITFSPKLDNISENIIYLLSLNSRLSITDLATILKINRKIIENRTKNLYNSGFIKPLLIFNPKKILKATILIKLSRFDEETLFSIKKLNTFVKVKETLGEYDLSLLIIVNNKTDFEEILEKINIQFHDIIVNMDVVFHELEDTLGYKSFCHDLKLIERYHLLSFNNEYELTKEETGILEMIKVKPNIKYNQLMTETGKNYQAIKRIINGMAEKQIIRFTVDPDYEKLGLQFHNILVKINLANRTTFEKNIISHPRIHWIKRSTGAWDYILSVASKDIKEFIEITRDIRTKNKSSILNFTTLISHIHLPRKV